MTEQSLLAKASVLSLQKLEINWRKISQMMLKQALPINPLTTHPDEGEPEGEDIHLWLEAVERNKHYTNKSVRSHCYSQEQFFEEILQQGKSKSKSRRLAILGSSGSGKTTLLHKIALWVLEKTEDVPIWISLADLGKMSIRQYLTEKWLERAKKSKTSANHWEHDFEALLNSGQLWLLLDGVDEWGLDSISLKPSSKSRDIHANIFNPLQEVTQQLQGWADKTRVILTSRSYIGENASAILSSFDVYSLLGLSYRDQVKPFIKKWFFPTTVNHYQLTASWQVTQSEKATNHQDLAKTLYQALEQFGQERLQELISTPLCLSLLCRLWQQRYPQLPATRAGLYEQLVAEFYQWQAEKVTTTIEQQQQLNQALGKLALQAMQTTTNPLWLSHHLVVDILGEDTPLFRLAIRLGWLKLTGMCYQNSQEKIYAFFDELFQEYFTALAIKDWRFFLPEQSNSQPSLNYPIFDRQWKRIILLWLGREDIAKTDKEAFIQALINFQDECTENNFYGLRAYFLAAAGLAEIESEKTQTIIQQLLQWALLDKNLPQPLIEAAKTAILETNHASAVSILIQWLKTGEETITKEVLKLLEKVGKDNPNAIAALIEQLETTESVHLRALIAESLGKIDEENSKAIQTLIQWLETTAVEEHRQAALHSLEKIGKGNPKIITAIVRRLYATESAVTERRTFECLEIIGQGNATAIAALVQLIRTTKDPLMRRQAAESLERIDPGNPTAITVLIQLLSEVCTEEICQQAVYSLGEITPGNEKAIIALVNLLSTSQPVFTHWLAVSSLGKIGAGNSETIKALVRIIQSSEQILLRKEAIESLSKIDPSHPVAITALVELMETTNDDSIRREIAENLGKIDPGNPEALAILTQVLHRTTDEFTRRQAAASLGSIDPGNLEAVFNLVQLIQATPDKDIQGLAAESLGEIGAQNPAAIATLIRLISPQQDSKILKLAAKSLGQIGVSYREAFAALSKILQFSEDESTRLQAAESLITLLSFQQIGEIIAPLKEIMSQTGKKHDLAIQKIIWHSVQHLSYPEFYRIWHAQPLSTERLESLNPPKTAQFHHLSWLEQLQQYLQDHPQLGEKVRLVCIDSGEFIDPQCPFVDIYEQMLAQNCASFEHGLPETLSKLRLYWNTLCRNQPQQIFVGIFYENLSESEDKKLPNALFQALTKFSGLICAISEQYVPPLQQFSAQMPDLSMAIAEWIEKNI